MKVNRSGIGIGVLAVLVLVFGWLMWPSSPSRAPASKAPAATGRAVAWPASAPVQSVSVPVPAPSAPAPAAREEVPAAVMPTPKPEWHIVASGETLAGIAKQYGLNWQLLCVHNRLSDCHSIQPNQSLNLVVTDESRTLAKLAPRHYFEQKLRYVVIDCAKTKLGYCTFSRVGGDPVCKRDQVAILSRDFNLSKQEAAGWVGVSKERGVIAAGTMINGLSFGGGYWSGPVKVMQDMAYRKGEIGGQVVGQFDACCNYFPLGSVPQPPAVVTPPVAEESPVVTVPPVVVPPVAEPVPPPVVEEPLETVKVARDYDWDAGLFVGGDKDVRYAGGEGAGYPVIKYYDWGRYALGGGGSFSLWQGGTHDGYRYSGETAAFGLAQKFSFNSRRDVGIKFPMIGGLWERGHDATGKYQQNRRASLWCASASYTDASREKDGEKWVPEWQIWASFCDPLSQAKSHSWEGQALDPSALQDTKYILGVGGRVFLSKNLGNQGLAAKLQPFVEVGANKTAPNPVSGHAYVGLRTVDKVWGLGAGLHFTDIENTLGATLTYDVGRHYKLHIQEERWNAMIRSLEALGVATD